MAGVVHHRPAAPAPPPGVAWGFTDRRGGVAPAPRDSLTLARADGLDDATLVENWRRAVAPLGGGATIDDLVLMAQVHGAEVRRVEAATGPLATVGPCDAVVTTVPGLVLAVRVADCVPVLLANARGVAAVHAGWRGVAAGVVPAAVRALARATGLPPEAAVAAVGPHVDRPHYEVGDEVVDGLVAAGVPRHVAVPVPPGPGERPHVDLGAAVAHQLREAGVASLGFAGPPTSGPTAFSHRHDGPSTGRQAGLVTRGRAP